MYNHAFTRPPPPRLSYLPLIRSDQGFSASQPASDHVTGGDLNSPLPLPYCVREQLWRRPDMVAGALDGKWLERDPACILIASSSSIATFASQSAFSRLPTTTSSPPPWTTLALGSAPSRANANIALFRRKPRLPGPLINHQHRKPTSIRSSCPTSSTDSARIHLRSRPPTIPRSACQPG